MNEMKRLYETTFIVNASLEDPQIEVIITKVLELITKNDGEIVATNRWGRKRMMYQINKKNSGYYVNLEYKAPTSTVKQLEHIFHLDEHIIRYLTIKVDKKAIQAKALAALRAPEEPAALIIDDVILKEPLFEEEDEAPVII